MDDSRFDARCLEQNPGTRRDALLEKHPFLCSQQCWDLSYDMLRYDLQWPTMTYDAMFSRELMRESYSWYCQHLSNCKFEHMTCTMSNSSALKISKRNNHYWNQTHKIQMPAQYVPVKYFFFLDDLADHLLAECTKRVANHADMIIDALWSFTAALSFVEMHNLARPMHGLQLFCWRRCLMHGLRFFIFAWRLVDVTLHKRSIMGVSNQINMYI